MNTPEASAIGVREFILWIKTCEPGSSITYATAQVGAVRDCPSSVTRRLDEARGAFLRGQIELIQQRTALDTKKSHPSRLRLYGRQAIGGEGSKLSMGGHKMTFPKYTRGDPVGFLRALAFWRRGEAGLHAGREIEACLEDFKRRERWLEQKLSVMHEHYE